MKHKYADLFKEAPDAEVEKIMDDAWKLALRINEIFNDQNQGACLAALALLLSHMIEVGKSEEGPAMLGVFLELVRRELEADDGGEEGDGMKLYLVEWQYAYQPASRTRELIGAKSVAAVEYHVRNRARQRGRSITILSTSLRAYGLHGS